MQMLNLTLKRPKRRNESWDRSVNVEIGSATRLAVALLLIFIGGLTYAMCGHQRKKLNSEVLELEEAQTQLIKDLRRERSRWSDMKSPAAMERRLRELRIPMQSPHERQIVYVAPQRESDTRLAQRR